MDLLVQTDCAHNCDCNSNAGSPSLSIESPSSDDDAFCPNQSPRSDNFHERENDFKSVSVQEVKKSAFVHPRPPVDSDVSTSGYIACEVRPDGPHGKTLVVLEDVRRGQPVIKFGGPIWGREEYERCEDYGHCLQIGANTFLGPYDGPDDYTDHSCDPSCYIVNREDKEAVLVALKDMKAGDRVTFDYATTLFYDYRFNCSCGCEAPNCRGVIHDFTLMTPEQQKDLYERGVLPSFIADWYVNKTVAPTQAPVPSAGCPPTQSEL